jgi:hypothetical protein
VRGPGRDPSHRGVPGSPVLTSSRGTGTGQFVADPASVWLWVASRAAIHNDDLLNRGGADLGG